MDNNKKPSGPVEEERWAKIEKEVQELKRSRSILSIGLFLLSGLYGILILCIILRIIRIEDTLTSIIQFNALVGEHLQSLGDSLIRIMKNLPASCGTPSGTQRPAICWHPARLRCVPGGWATRARTALRLPSAMGSTAAIELTSTHLRGNVSTAARWTACRRYALYEKSPPVRQHRRAARDDEFERLHHPDDITKSEVLQ